MSASGRDVSAPPGTTFETLGLHAHVCAALAERNITVPLDFQWRTLQHTVHDYADIVAEALPHSGRHTLMCALVAHCLLSSDNPGRSCVVVVANNASTAAKLHGIMQSLESCRVQSVHLADDRSGGPPKLVSNSTHGVAYFATLNVLNRLTADHLDGIVSLFVEDAMHHDPKVLQQLLERVITAAPAANMFLLSSQPPSQVNMSIRYLLRRKNRRYYFQETGTPNYSFLLCNDQEDRLELNMRVAQMKGLKSVLVLTHNREVRDLKAYLHQQLGFKTFSIQRNTSLSDHDRVLSDFLRSQYAVLVAMDAYTGIDLMDVDAVIQVYPPQKSMPEEEWSEYTSYLQTTNNPAKPTVVVTLVGADDFALVSYFMRRLNLDLPVLNVSPSHPQFSDIVRNSNAVLAEKTLKEKQHNGGRAVQDIPAPPPPPPPPPPREDPPVRVPLPRSTAHDSDAYIDDPRESGARSGGNRSGNRPSGNNNSHNNHSGGGGGGGGNNNRRDGARRNRSD